MLGVVHHDDARLRLEGQLTNHNVVVVHDNGGRLAVVADGPQMVVNVEVARRVLTDLLRQRRVGQRQVVLVRAHLGRRVNTAAFLSGRPAPWRFVVAVDVGRAPAPSAVELVS